jgi:hypothetical protein
MLKVPWWGLTDIFVQFLRKVGLFLRNRDIEVILEKVMNYRPYKQTNSVAFRPQAKYTDTATASAGEVSVNFYG